MQQIVGHRLSLGGGVPCRMLGLKQNVTVIWRRSTVASQWARQPKCETAICGWQSITGCWLRPRSCTLKRARTAISPLTGSDLTGVSRAPRTVTPKDPGPSPPSAPHAGTSKPAQRPAWDSAWRCAAAARGRRPQEQTIGKSLELLHLDRQHFSFRNRQPKAKGANQVGFRPVSGLGDQIDRNQTAQWLRAGRRKCRFHRHFRKRHNWTECTVPNSKTGGCGFEPLRSCQRVAK